MSEKAIDVFADKSDFLNKVSDDHGFYDEDNRWWSVEYFNDKIYRKRVETIIIRNDKEVFVKKKPNNEYSLPGGQTENDATDIQQAINECNEEACIVVEDIYSTGINYTLKYDHSTKNYIDKDKTKYFEYYGTYTDVYVGRYAGMYKGYIKKEDRDPFIKSGKWIPISECFKFFRPEHRKALSEYIKNKDELLNESYLGNYVKNEFKLKKISRNGDFKKEEIKYMCKSLFKKYKENKNSSFVKRNVKKGEDGKLQYPTYVYFCMKFKDGNQSINFGIDYNKEEFSPAYAWSAFDENTHEEKFYVSVTPKFFVLDEETQIFVLLHEIGHIRLGHTIEKNQVKNNDRLREIRMRQSKVQYPEKNADLYALLNGASLYTILSLSADSDIEKRGDEYYDLRYTNGELSNRYLSAWKRYKRLVSENTICAYDVANTALKELIYESGNILSSKDRDNLYKLAYDQCILKSIPSINGRKFDEGTIKVLFDVGYFKENGEDNIDINNLAHEVSLYKEKYLEVLDNLKDRLIIECEPTEKNSYYVYLIESMTKKERDLIPLEKFGIPEERKYPLDTKEHVKSAIRLFGKCEPKYRDELAKNILKAMEEFNIDKSMIGPKSRLYKYL